MLVLLGLTSGGLWGAFGYWLVRDTGLSGVAWIALAASPLIGVVITFLAASARPRTLLGRLVLSWSDLLLAVFLFALVLALAPVPSAPPRPAVQSFTASSEVVATDPCKDPATAQTANCNARQSAMEIALDGVVGFMLVSGFGLLLLPCSLANHYLIWSWQESSGASGRNDKAASFLKAEITSPRLRYERVSLTTVNEFHSLVVDAHVRRYLMDDTVFPVTWAEDRVRDSEALFATRGVGLWLSREHATGALVGFCGFLELPSVHPDPQLVYALLKPFTGRGYATEMASAAIAHARRQPGFEEIIASVDDVNASSIRVIQKLGFVKIDAVPGSLGGTSIFRLT